MEHRRSLTLNYEFHRLIVQMSANSQIQEHIDRAMTEPLRLQAARFMDPDALRQSHAEHQPILAAIRRRDPEAAELTMRKHIRSTRSVFLAMPDSIFPFSLTAGSE